MIHDPNYLPAGHELGLLSRMGAAPAESDASEAATAAKSGKSEPTKNYCSAIVLPISKVIQTCSNHLPFATALSRHSIWWLQLGGEWNPFLN